MTDQPGRSLPNKSRRDEALNELEKALKSRERKAKAAPLGVVFSTLLVLVVIVGGITYLALKDPGADQQDNQAASSPAMENAALPAGPLKPYADKITCDYKDEPATAGSSVGKPEAKDITTKGTRQVTLTINGKKVPLSLDNGKSPCTTNSFDFLASEGFYDNTVCHRSVKSESMTILQCGDPTAKGSGGPGYTFADEYPTNGVEGAAGEQPVTYPRGTLAMANSGPDTNGSQFFLVTGDTTLPPKYNIFGTIEDSGLKVLDDILKDAPEGDGKPSKEVKIDKASA